MGRSVRRLSTLSGSRVPFLPLSVAASWPLLLLPLCWVSLCLCLVLPPLLCLLSSCLFALTCFWMCVCLVALPLAKVGDSCDLSCCSGARVHCLRVEFALSFTGAAMSFLSFCGFSPPRFSAVSLVCLLSRCLLVVVWVRLLLFLSLSVWVGEVGPGPEPWTGLHCSELHWR